MYLDVELPAGAALDLTALAAELVLFPVEGEAAVDGQIVQAQTMAVLERWNFVSSRKERIAQAARDWEAQRMGRVPGETEFIPLPRQASP